MGKGPAGAGIVLLHRHGDRWRADVYERTDEGRVRKAAEVVGSFDCVQLVAREGARLLSQPDGRALFVDFLSANRCRVIGPAAAVSHRQLAAKQPANAHVKPTR